MRPGSIPSSDTAGCDQRWDNEAIDPIKAQLDRYRVLRAINRRISNVRTGVGEDHGYCIRPGYKSRSRPAYFHDEDKGILWQPDVYSEAVRVAREHESRRMIDLGCGAGRRIAELHPSYEVAGIDYGPNIAEARRMYPFGEWIEHDFDGPNALPLSDEQIRNAVLVCADVIEHLLRPDHLLTQLAERMDVAAALVLSTPERELTWGPDHLGPPPNTAHVREWTTRELRELFERCGLHAEFSLTRSNDKTNALHTILAIAR